MVQKFNRIHVKKGNSMVDFMLRIGPHRSILFVIGVNIILHIMVMGNFKLSPDEAHYALYALHLDWSYFDHPPLTGWLQYLAMYISEHEFSLRIWPLLLMSWTIYVVYQLSNFWFPDENKWVSFWAATFISLMPLYQLLSMALIPETLLIVWGAGIALWLTKSLSTPTTKNWIILGILFGLAGMSKYTAVTLVISTIIILIHQHHWSLIKTKGPWLSVIIALIIISPVFYWNATHDWISFLYQLHRTGSHNEWAGSTVWSGQTFLAAQIGQMLSYGPIFYLLGWGLVFTSFTKWGNKGVVYSIVFSLPLLVLININSGYYPNPYWVALAWVLVTPYVANWVWKHWYLRVVRISTIISFMYAILFGSYMYVQLGTNYFDFPDGKNPFAELYGWDLASERANELRVNYFGDNEDAKLFVGSWTIASRLAWYSRPAPVVVTDKWFDQFDLWYGSPQNGAYGIFVSWSMYTFEPKVGRGTGMFDSCKHIETMPVHISGKVAAYYNYYSCVGYKL